MKKIELERIVEDQKIDIEAMNSHIKALNGIKRHQALELKDHENECNYKDIQFWVSVAITVGVFILLIAK